jgi:hypothetical protein
MFAGEKTQTLMINAHKGDPKARDEFLSLMIRGGGLRALIYLGWMGDPSENINLINPEKVAGFIVEKFIDPPDPIDPKEMGDQCSIGFSGRTVDPSEWL